MKKLLGIVVLGLLLSSNAYAKTIKIKEKWTSSTQIVTKKQDKQYVLSLNGDDPDTRTLLPLYATNHCSKYNKYTYFFAKYHARWPYEDDFVGEVLDPGIFNKHNYNGRYARCA